MRFSWRRTAGLGAARLRLFFASDIHGSDVCFRKFLNAAGHYRATVLVMGGDLTGKALVPIVELGSGHFEATFMGERLRADAEGMADLERRVRFNGFYPYRCSPEENELLGRDESQRREAFAREMRRATERWVALADERLPGTGVRCFVMPGNDDELLIDEVLASSRAIENHDGRIAEVEGYRLIGHGWSNRTPWRTAREKDEPEIEEDLRRLLDEAGQQRPIIFNPHVPPHGSGLDLAPRLREDLSVVSRAGQPEMVPVGSTAVRRVIEEYQPLISLHGHIHESRGVVRLGRTVSVNPGSEYNVGRLLGALVDLEAGTVGNVQLVAG